MFEERKSGKEISENACVHIKVHFAFACHMPFGANRSVPSTRLHRQYSEADIGRPPYRQSGIKTSYPRNMIGSLNGYGAQSRILAVSFGFHGGT